MSRWMKKGSKVCQAVRRSRRSSMACGVLLENARIGADAGWDTGIYNRKVKIRLDSGRKTSAFAFDLRLPSKKTQRQRRR